jgi:iron complex transport system permease protein
LPIRRASCPPSPSGSLTLATPFELALAAALLVAGLAPLVALRWRLDLLTLPDEEARALGVEPARLRALVIGAATLITAVSVALGGIIGWIGLLVPHAARLMVGPSFARLLPLSMLLGAAFLVGVDTLCRVVTQIELPPGVVTALLGTPFFLWLFAAARRSW